MPPHPALSPQAAERLDGLLPLIDEALERRVEDLVEHAGADRRAAARFTAWCGATLFPLVSAINERLRPHGLLLVHDDTALPVDVPREDPVEGGADEGGEGPGPGARITSAVTIRAEAALGDRAVRVGRTTLCFALDLENDRVTIRQEEPGGGDPDRASYYELGRANAGDVEEALLHFTESVVHGE